MHYSHISSENKCLVILTNIPTPYRIAFFNVLHQVLLEQQVVLHVIYCADREPNRQWKIRLEEQKYSWQILPGLHVSIGNWYPHINMTIISTLYKLKPTWLLVAGAWNTPTMLLAMCTRRLQRLPVMFWSEGHPDAVRNPSGLIAWLRQAVLRTYDAYAVPNKRSGMYILSETGLLRPLLMLPNSVDESFYGETSQLNRSLLREKYSIGPEQRVLVCVSRLEDFKGVLELLHAYLCLSLVQQDKCTLVFIGDGSLYKTLKEIEKKHSQIHVFGFLEKDQVREILAISDIFVLPSKRDPNPLSVIEAAFAGLPLLVSNKAGNAYDIVIEGLNGYVLQKLEPEYLAGMLNNMLKLSSAELKRMGGHSSQIANDNFRRDEIAKRFTTQLLDSYLIQPMTTNQTSNKICP